MAVTGVEGSICRLAVLGVDNGPVDIPDRGTRDGVPALGVAGEDRAFPGGENWPVLTAKGGLLDLAKGGEELSVGVFWTMLSFKRTNDSLGPDPPVLAVEVVRACRDIADFAESGMSTFDRRSSRLVLLNRDSVEDFGNAAATESKADCGISVKDGSSCRGYTVVCKEHQ